MSPQSLAESLFPLVHASATQPRGNLRSPFSPLVSWLATSWASEDHEIAKMDRFLVPEPHLFTSPIINFHNSSKKYPALPCTLTFGVPSRDNNYDNASEMCIQPHKDGLTEKELDYVVHSLLEYLEEAKLASPESGCEEYEYYAPENTERGLRPGLWSPESPLYVMHDNKDEYSPSEAETLEMDETYDRASLELARTACDVPELRDGDEEYPYHFEFEFEVKGNDSE